jgi:hypothetical protein
MADLDGKVALVERIRAEQGEAGRPADDSGYR